MSRLLIIPILLIILSYLTLHSHASASPDTLIPKIENSLRHSLKYMEQNVGKMPLDATFGLNAAVWVLGDHPLGLWAKNITDRDVVTQKKNHPKYYGQFHDLVGKWRAWPVRNPVEKFIGAVHAGFEDSPRRRRHNLSAADQSKSRPTVSPSTTQKETHFLTNFFANRFKDEKCKFQEDESDTCLQNAIHCKLTPKCAKYESIKTRKNNYCLTHQMLYYEFLRRFCPKNKRRVHRRAEKALQLLTLELYDESSEIKAIETWTDKWMERYVLGTMVGAYKEFVQDDILEYVMERQLPQGCWNGEDEHVRFHKKKQSADDLKSRFSVGSDEASDLIDYDSGSDCAYHTTGLAIYYLSVSLAYLYV